MLSYVKVDSSRVPQEIHDKFNNYHEALEHKLKSTKHNLGSLHQTTKLTDLAGDLSEFRFKANLYIDGFFIMEAVL